MENRLKEKEIITAWNVKTGETKEIHGATTGTILKDVIENFLEIRHYST